MKLTIAILALTLTACSGATEPEHRSERAPEVWITAFRECVNPRLCNEPGAIVKEVNRDNAFWIEAESRGAEVRFFSLEWPGCREGLEDCVVTPDYPVGTRESTILIPAQVRELPYPVWLAVHAVGNGQEASYEVLFPPITGADPETARPELFGSFARE